MASSKEIRDYLVRVLTQPVGIEVKLEVPAGTGYNIVQRMRVELSRVRSKLAAKRTPAQRFKLYSRINLSSKTNMDEIVFIRTPEGGAPPVAMDDLEKMLAEGV